MERSVRVLVVADDDRAAAELRCGASRGPSLSVIGPVRPREALTAVRMQEPQVVLVRVSVTAADIAALLGDIRRQDPKVPILVHAVASNHHELPSVVLAAGGCGVLAPDAAPAARREAVLRARAGELVLDDDELQAVMLGLGDPRGAPSARGTLRLTPREREVLQRVAEGCETVEIAVDLGIAPATVQSHVKNVLAKLGVHSKVEAVRLAWRDGLVPVPG